MELIHEGDRMRSSADVYLGCSGSSPENLRQTIWLNTRAFILCDPSSARHLGGPHLPTSAWLDCWRILHVQDAADTDKPSSSKRIIILTGKNQLQYFPINSKYIWNFLIKLQALIYFAQRHRHFLCSRALHQTHLVLNSRFNILWCIWQHEPRSQMGTLRIEASRKTVTWTWDKIWLEWHSADLPEYSGMLFWALGGSWEIVCIKTLERGPIAATGEREGQLLLQHADMPEWGPKMGGGYFCLRNLLRKDNNRRSFRGGTDRQETGVRATHVTISPISTVRHEVWLRQIPLHQQQWKDQNARFCVVCHVLSLRRQWELYFVICCVCFCHALQAGCWSCGCLWKLNL